MDSIESWGNYPLVKGEVVYFDPSFKEKNFLPNSIPYGNGRSYGDSCLSDSVIKTKKRNHLLSFNEENGFLTLQSGVLLEEIISVFLPRGWYLKINPGTKLITVGGAIASDIHGKNHHIEGCFSQCVQWFSLMLPSGEIIKCSETQNSEMFLASCGGMGLTGVIVDACIQLKKVQSQFIHQTVTKTKNLKETFEVFESIKHIPYSVAWIDCLQKGKKRGRSLIMHGDFGSDGNLNYKPKKNINIPFYFPGFCLNKWSVKAFNWFYYNKVFKKITQSTVGIDTFFFPLDAINNWNRIYGKGGFTQYQFILPLEHSFKGLEEILEEIAKSGKGSFLAVLKLYGKANENWLSFPIEGYSLALDFKIDKTIFQLLDQLDKIVLKYKGRIYLTKDVRVSKETFEQGYPKINQFRALRKKHNFTSSINSLQSKRVGI